MSLFCCVSVSPFILVEHIAKGCALSSVLFGVTLALFLCPSRQQVVVSKLFRRPCRPHGRAFEKVLQVPCLDQAPRGQKNHTFLFSSIFRFFGVDVFRKQVTHFPTLSHNIPTKFRDFTQVHTISHKTVFSFFICSHM